MTLNEKEFKQIIQTLNYPVSVLDLDGTILFSNQSFLNAFGGENPNHLLFASSETQANDVETSVAMAELLHSTDETFMIWSFKNFKQRIKLSPLNLSEGKAFLLTFDTEQKSEGRIAIRKYVEQSIGQLSKRTILSVNIDRFKSYNDKYGYEKGDEVITYLRDLLQEIPSNFELKEFFIGHLEKDRFVVILDEDYALEASKLIISFFDQTVGNFYNGLDRRQGSIALVSRAGQVINYPLMTVSIGALNFKDVPTMNYHQIMDICEEVVSKAKENNESHYYFNKRTY